MLELGCARPDYWELTPAELEALTAHWKKQKIRDGWKFPGPDTPENRKASQAALLPILMALSKKPAAPK